MYTLWKFQQDPVPDVGEHLTEEVLQSVFYKCFAKWIFLSLIGKTFCLIHLRYSFLLIRPSFAILSFVRHTISFWIPFGTMYIPTWLKFTSPRYSALENSDVLSPGNTTVFRTPYYWNNLAQAFHLHGTSNGINSEHFCTFPQTIYVQTFIGLF